MTDTKFCPLMRDIDGRILKCFHEKCAWWMWADEVCAMKGIAIYLNRIANKGERKND